MYLTYVALMIAACLNSTDLNVGELTRSRDPISHSPEEERKSLVTLRIVRRTKETLFLELRNESDYPIFPSYIPPNEGTEAVFLTYDLQTRITKDGKFRQYGEGFHYVPPLNRINAHSGITFHLIPYPSKKGEYRVQLAYYEDESVYRMINERLIKMTEAEELRAYRDHKYVWSDSFFVR